MKVIERIRQQNQIVRGVLYSRYSSDLQREESIEAQLRDMKRFCELYNIVIVREYIDRAITATRDDREQFQQMIKDSAKGQFDIVIVHKLDRFARNRRDSMGYRVRLMQNNVRVLASSQPYDAESPEGMMMEAMLEAMAEYYSLNLAKEVEKGKRENALKGMHVGGKPPLGYDVDKKTMKLVINEYEAQIVRLIFDIALQGGGYGEIIQELNKRGYKSKKGQPFGKNSLLSILRNEKYTGTYIYSKSAAKDYEGKRNGSKQKEDSEIIRVENAVPPIITKEEFEMVRARFNKRKHTAAGRSRAKEIYLLSGKIRCGVCGSTYIGHRREANQDHPKYVSYKCGKKNKSVKCPNGEIRREAIEAQVLDELSKLVFNNKIIPEIVDSYNEFINTYCKESIQEIENIKNRLNELEKQIANVVNILENTGSTALAKRLQELEAEQAVYENELYVVAETVSASQVTKEQLQQAFKQARRLLKNKTLPNLQQLVEAFVDKVVLYEESIEIVFNVGMNPEILEKVIPHQNARQSLSNAVSSTPTRDVADGGEGFKIFITPFCSAVYMAY